MIATIQVDNRSCIIQKVARKGLRVAAVSWCGSEASAADGVYQIADAAYSRCCDKCRAALETWTKTKL